MKGRGKENIRKQDGLERGRTEKESKERDILIEGTIMWIARFTF